MSDECKCGFDHWPLPCKDEKPPNERAQSSFAAPAGYTAAQQLDMLCEILRNVNNGVMHINAANFDHAALDLEVAASKLRTLEKAKAV